MDGNGWSDIGYNFCIGDTAQIYEGRGKVHWFSLIFPEIETFNLHRMEQTRRAFAWLQRPIHRFLLHGKFHDRSATCCCFERRPSICYLRTWLGTIDDELQIAGTQTRCGKIRCCWPVESMNFNFLVIQGDCMPWRCAIQ
jgi:hypothetical protein